MLARTPNQAYYFAELNSRTDSCVDLNMQYEELSMGSEHKPLTELKLQQESGVLEILQNALHYTYTFFPDDSTKAEVPMQVY